MVTIALASISGCMTGQVMNNCITGFDAGLDTVWMCKSHVGVCTMCITSEHKLASHCDCPSQPAAFAKSTVLVFASRQKHSHLSCTVLLDSNL